MSQVNEQLIKQLKQVIEQYDSGLLPDYEVLWKAMDISFGVEHPDQEYLEAKLAGNIKEH